MPDNRRTTHIAGAGTLPRFFIPKVLAAGEPLGATSVIATFGWAEFNRQTLADTPRLVVPGATNVSPNEKQVRIAIGMAGSNSFAEAVLDSWERPSVRMVDDMIRAMERQRVVGCQTLWYQGMRTGHAVPGNRMLRRLKERKPDQFILAKTTLPDDADQRPQAVIGYELFAELHAEQVIEVALMSDNGGPFARTFTLAEQDRFEAKATAGLIVAQAQFGKTKSLGEIGRSLGQYGVFASWALTSRTLEPAREGLVRRVASAVGWQTARYDEVYVQHIVHEAKLATATVVTDPAARTIDEDIDWTRPLFLVYLIPVPIAQSRAWEAISSEVRRWLTATYPNAVPIFVSGEGTPDPRYAGEHWLQVSCLFPLPPVPRPIRSHIEPRRATGTRPATAIETRTGTSMAGQRNGATSAIGMGGPQ